MTDLDLDRLGDLWRQRPTPSEMKSLRRTAEAVQRKARWGQRLDYAAAIVVASIVVLLVLSSPTFDTMLVGGAALVVLLLSQSRTRRLRSEELRGLTGSTQEMLDQSIVRARATLNRTRFKLIATAPSFVLGLGVAAMVDKNSGDFYGRLLSRAGLSLWIIAAGIILLILLALAFGRSIRKTRAELERLTTLRAAFEAEGVNSADDDDET